MMTTKLLMNLNCQFRKSSLLGWNLTMSRNFATTEVKQQQTRKTQNSKDGNKGVPVDAADLVMTAKWRTIFKFPYMKQVVSINKVKMYHTGFTFFLLPTSFMIPEYLNPVIVAAIGGTGIATLGLVSFVLKNFIGFIYTSEDHPKLIRFAYINIWGKRIDEIFEISGIKLLENIKLPVVSDLFSFVEFDDQKKKLKLAHNFGGIIDREKFYEIFGNEK